ncbi:MAG: hypothetical protein AAFQ98_11580 [Bacteroidota bacterium]
MKATRIPSDFTDPGQLPKGLAFTWVGYQEVADLVRDALGIAYSPDEIQRIIQGKMENPEVVQIAKQYLQTLKAGMCRHPVDPFQYRLQDPHWKEEGLF